MIDRRRSTLSDRSKPLDEWPRSDIDTDSPGYFELMGIPLRAGRALSESDGDDAPQVAVINERAARLLWPDLSAGEWPLDHQLMIDNGGEEDEVTWSESLPMANIAASPRIPALRCD